MLHERVTYEQEVPKLIWATIYVQADHFHSHLSCGVVLSPYFVFVRVISWIVLLG